ncbi:MAG: hypothetical protein LAP13_21915 [Acidobacteriia bacterium]|nr:hypothetical protein [Terriglobia bacterium]
MKPNLWTLFALTVVIFLYPLRGRAGAIIHSSGLEAYATTDTWDESGCVETVVYMDAVRGKAQQPPGPPAPGAFLYAGISLNNICTGEWSYAYGGTTLADSDFQIAKNLNNAQLAATPSLDGTHCSAPDENGQVSCNEIHLSGIVNLSWTPTTPPSSERQTDSNHTPKCNQTYRATGTFRMAAVSGSFSDGTNNYGFAEDAFALMGSARYSTLIVGCSSF